MFRNIRILLAVMALAATALACDEVKGLSPGEDIAEGGYSYREYADAALESGGAIGGESGGEGSGNTSAGMLTAGEWRDLEHWDFWGQLMLSQNDTTAAADGGFSQYNAYWGFYTRSRVAVSVRTATGAPASGVPVILRYGGKDVWTARTDNKGRASCWFSLFEDNAAAPDSSKLALAIDGKVRESAVQLTRWASDTVYVNEFFIDSHAVSADVDIAFIVDATGSMGDEIEFLKSDLADIIGKVGRMSTKKIRTAALMYRDTDDEYVTKPSNFSDVATTAAFIAKQSAAGGGDYPEAVHTALEKSLQNLSWNESAHSRLAFLVLDAPAHHNADVIASLHTQIEAFAKAGIRIIPVAASGVDKGTEFMLRYFAIATGGTYVFLTNDSGIGGDHIAASVGKYEVEQLNELIVRIITEFIE